MLIFVVAALVSLASSLHLPGLPLRGVIDGTSSTTPVVSGASIVKRQTELRRELQAIFTYTCPHAGEEVRIFRWDAVYTFATAKLVLSSLQNVDRFFNVHGDEETQKFHANWDHSYCIEGEDEVCVYNVKAYVHGRVKYNGITMLLTVVSVHEEEEPTVHEHCEKYEAHPANTCPAVIQSDSHYACHIDNIQVSSIGHQ